MSLGCYYYFDEYPFSSTEDLYGKYKNISGPPIYDTYGEDVMIVEPMDFVFREFKTMHAYVKDFMGSINNGTLRSNGGARNLDQSNSRFEDYMDNRAFEKMSSKQYSTRHHDEEQEDLKSFALMLIIIFLFRNYSQRKRKKKREKHPSRFKIPDSRFKIRGQIFSNP